MVLLMRIKVIKLPMAMSTSQYSRLSEIFWWGLDIGRPLDLANSIRYRYRTVCHRFIGNQNVEVRIMIQLD